MRNVGMYFIRDRHKISVCSQYFLDQLHIAKEITKRTEQTEGEKGIHEN